MLAKVGLTKHKRKMAQTFYFSFRQTALWQIYENNIELTVEHICNLGPPRSVLWLSLCRKSIFATSHTVKYVFLSSVAFDLDLNFSVRRFFGSH